ncbi:type I secretion system permease/ATPase [Sphingobium sp. CCH11-B1]|jgi:ATP-binding cassette subfamily C protein|uniref:type I secretion system permease/ATPase n=1 Tax=Sphingobium sp. CCH11-B1 TaxID=1768781 RepID=UPI00083137BF|nr:type I secretion system permease/ATPase [Sphingobium sp. CCH11-B1]MEA3389263.1 type I secretion system permease/ATPase [Pseudomonadota bacterium]
MATDVAALNPLRQALRACRKHIMWAGIFSAVLNLLYLAPSIYMMQIYDRVVPGGSVGTLIAVSAITILCLATLSMLDWLRQRILFRAGAQLETELVGRTLRLLNATPQINRVERTEAMRQFDTLRQSISSSVSMALLDAPWAPIYIGAAFLLHPLLGLLTLAASLLLLALAIHNDRATAQPMKAAGHATSLAYAKQAHVAAHAAEVHALGMSEALARRQLADRENLNLLQMEATFIGGTHGSVIKFFRLVLQSSAIGVGALLVVEGSLSAGAMFASSLLLSRALAPIEQIVASWRPLLGARAAYAALNKLYEMERLEQHTRLPAPSGAVTIDNLTMAKPMSDRIAVANVSATIEAGEVIGVVGPSGSGKSTLLRALTGCEPPVRGTVRYDGASLSQWDPEQLAQHIGYVPQNFILFAGTVRDNISRFAGMDGGDDRIIDEATVKAAKIAMAHDTILRLPDGYDTLIGAGGIGLSAGQMQRIALARALYGDPKILVLDEPTAHLDIEAKQAFMSMLSANRARGITVILATHCRDTLASVDKLMVLRDGKLEHFGPLLKTASLADATNASPKSHDSRKAVG